MKISNDVVGLEFKVIQGTAVIGIAILSDIAYNKKVLEDTVKCEITLYDGSVYSGEFTVRVIEKCFNENNQFDLNKMTELIIEQRKSKIKSNLVDKSQKSHWISALNLGSNFLIVLAIVRVFILRQDSSLLFVGIGIMSTISFLLRFVSIRRID